MGRPASGWKFHRPQLDPSGHTEDIINGLRLGIISVHVVYGSVIFFTK